MKVYWSSIEYKYNENSHRLKGGFVYSFIKANDVRDALKNLLSELKNKKLEVVEIEFLSPYDLNTVWKTKKQTNRYKELYEEANVSNNIVVFDDFYSYENDL